MGLPTFHGKAEAPLMGRDRLIGQYVGPLATSYTDIAATGASLVADDQLHSYKYKMLSHAHSLTSFLIVNCYCMFY